MTDEASAATRSNRQAVILRLAGQYQASMVRSSNENEERASIRENVEKLGVDPRGFQVAVRMSKGMTPGERNDYSNGITDTLEAIDGHEADLFGQAEIDARNKRAEKRQAKAAEAKDKVDNPRGDPARGGAGGVDGTKKAKDAKPKPVENKLSKRKAKGGDNVVPIGKKAKGAKADQAPAGDPPTDPPAAPPAETETPPGEASPPIGDPPPDDEHAGETGDEMIARISREKMAELEQREGATALNQVGTKPVDDVVDNESKPADVTDALKSA